MASALGPTTRATMDSKEKKTTRMGNTRREVVKVLETTVIGKLCTSLVLM